MIEDQFENAINELEGLAKGLGSLTNDLIETALEPIGLLLEEDDNGKPLYESSEKEDLEGVIFTLKNDIIPLCEESRYSEGEEKARKMIEIFQNSLEK